MTRIALATAAQYPELSPDDQILFAAMRQRGLAAAPVIWDAEIDWAAFDIVVIRSIWDYHLKYQRFLDWLKRLDDARVPVQNSTLLLRWNADKRYLTDLQQKHVKITPTRVISREDHATLPGVMAETGWLRAVIKPVVSSTGYETWIVDAPCTLQEEERFTRQSKTMDILVQEFAHEVQMGEFSFVFIGGEYSHCILKRAAADEFRVHIEHGGTVELIQPSRAQIDWARSVVATLGDESWTYARVDAVAGHRGMKLMEFELLDPELFFTYKFEAVNRFIDTVLAHVR